VSPRGARLGRDFKGWGADTPPRGGTSGAWGEWQIRRRGSRGTGGLARDDRTFPRIRTVIGRWGRDCSLLKICLVLRPRRHTRYGLPGLRTRCEAHFARALV
jgi:hypothetical protein